MSEPAYYLLKEVEALFRLSRASLTRWAKAGIFDLHGANKGRRVSGASVRAAQRRVEQGEDLWQVVKESEARAAQRTERAVSTKMRKADGGISRLHTTESDSLASRPLMSKPHSWRKKTT